MTDDATLSDFLQSDGSEEADANDDREAAASEATATTDADRASDDALEAEPDATADSTTSAACVEEPIDSGLSTYAWGEYTCAHCGDDTERVWRSDGNFVCPDCKPW